MDDHVKIDRDLELERKRKVSFEFLKGNHYYLSFNAIAKALGGEKPVHNFQEMVFEKRKFPTELIEPLYEFLNKNFSIDSESNYQEKEVQVITPVEFKKETFPKNVFHITKNPAGDISVSASKFRFVHTSKSNKLQVNGEEVFDFGLITKLKMMSEMYDKLISELKF